MLYELTTHSEDAIKFVSDALDRDLRFVGTESRLKRIIQSRGDEMTVLTSFLTPKGSLSTWPIERPRSLLIAIANRFGKPLPGFNGEKIVFEQNISVLTESTTDALRRAMIGNSLPGAVCTLSDARKSRLGVGTIHVFVAFKVDEEYGRALQAAGYSIGIATWKKYEGPPTRLR